MVKKTEKKCLLQTEYCMAVIRQMTGEVDVTAPGSSRRPPVSLESGLDMTRRQ